MTQSGVGGSGSLQLRVYDSVYGVGVCMFGVGVCMFGVAVCIELAGEGTLVLIVSENENIFLLVCTGVGVWELYPWSDP